MKKRILVVEDEARILEVVEYALSRSLSPTLVAEYQTALPSKALLRRKLHELYAQLAPRAEDDIDHLNFSGE